MKERKLIAFMNSYTQGINGGDTCFIEIAKRIDHYDKIVVFWAKGYVNLKV